MIDPHVEHGGASSWFCMVAKAEPNFATEGAEDTELADAEAAEAVALTSSASCSGVVVTSSRLFTPARNWASGDRNFAAIQRKM
jgi:hypothetical protein